MSWNYRVMRQIHAEESVDTIQEVYYDKDNIVTGWTQTGATVFRFVDEDGSLQDMLDRFAEALTKPILDFETGLEI